MHPIVEKFKDALYDFFAAGEEVLPWQSFPAETVLGCQYIGSLKFTGDGDSGTITAVHNRETHLEFRNEKGAIAFCLGSRDMWYHDRRGRIVVDTFWVGRFTITPKPSLP